MLAPPRNRPFNRSAAHAAAPADRPLPSLQNPAPSRQVTYPHSASRAEFLLGMFETEEETKRVRDVLTSERCCLRACAGRVLHFWPRAGLLPWEVAGGGAGSRVNFQ